MDFETYMKYRSVGEEGRYAEQRAYDRTLVHLSAGGLALALAFLRTAPADGPACGVWVTLASAVAFGASIVACLCSMRVSVRAHDRWLEELEHHYKEEKEFAEITESHAVERFNTTAWVSFVAAAVLLAAAVTVMAI